MKALRAPHHEADAWGTYLIKGTKSPNLSKLFAYFISTDIGQDALDAATGYSTMDRASSTKARLIMGLCGGR